MLFGDSVPDVGAPPPQGSTTPRISALRYRRQGSVRGWHQPASCEASSDDTSVDLTCGDGGPVYTVTASDSDEDDDEDAAINLIVH